MEVTRAQERKAQVKGEAGYKKLIVWKKADALAYKVYLQIRNSPKDEI